MEKKACPMCGFPLEKRRETAEFTEFRCTECGKVVFAPKEAVEAAEDVSALGE
jgi:ribosomal protein L37E